MSLYDKLPEWVKWLYDRLTERATKIFIMQAISALVLLGVISKDKADDITTAIEVGQATVSETVDSVAAAIDVGEALIETGKDTIEYAKDTGTRIWEILGTAWMFILAVFGISQKDAKKGQEVETRELLLIKTIRDAGLQLPAELKS